MMSLPEPQDAADLPLDQLALCLLRQISEDDQRPSGGKPQIREYVNTAAWPSITDHQTRFNYIRLLQEAWDWLLTHGLITSSEPTQHLSGGFTFITRRGTAVLDDPKGLERLSAEIRIDVALHERIQSRVRPQFLIGDYELAAIAALREVEIRVRELSGLDSLWGHKLVTAAFRQGGPLFDRDLDAGESQATMNLFDGAIGVFKNPPSHRQVEYGDPTEASEVVLLADLLLRLLDRVEARLEQPG